MNEEHHVHQFRGIWIDVGYLHYTTKKSLTIFQVLVLAYIANCHQKYGCPDSDKEMANDLNLSLRKIRSCLKKLKSLNLVREEHKNNIRRLFVGDAYRYGDAL